MKTTTCIELDLACERFAEAMKTATREDVFRMTHDTNGVHRVPSDGTRTPRFGNLNRK